MTPSPVVPVLFADDAVVVVDKPAGLAVHRSHLVGADDDYLVDRVRAQTGRTLYLAHRLDRATSGAIDSTGNAEGKNSESFSFHSMTSGDSKIFSLNGGRTGTNRLRNANYSKTYGGDDELSR